MYKGGESVFLEKPPSGDFEGYLPGARSQCGRSAAVLTVCPHADVLWPGDLGAPGCVCCAESSREAALQVRGSNESYRQE